MSRLDGILLGYLPYEGLVEIRSVGVSATHLYPFTPTLRRATTAEPMKFNNLIGKLVRLHVDTESWQVERVEEIKNDQT